ncbi:MAG: HAMP domain-containing histidine kinase [Gammaproteobacteria bacterium]|nr:HAMP domain-containing histidine kinase [Gammaproteobacteria bacterium]
MVNRYPSSLIQRFTRYLAQRVEDYGAQYMTYGLFGLMNAPGYYLIWRYVAQQPYESGGLRLVCLVLCAILAAHKQWPQRLKLLLPLYWYLTILVTLPYFFTILLLLNHSSAIWMTNTVVMIFFTLLLVDSRSAIVLLIGGGLLGIATVIGVFHQPLTLAYLMDYRGFLLTILISVVIGTLFAHNRENFEQLKRQAIECREKNLFIENMSHDLRTAITGILSVLEADRQQLPPDHPIQQTLDQVYQAAHQIHQFHEHLLEIAQQPDENEREQQTVFSIPSLVSAVEQLFTPALQQKGLQYTRHATTSVNRIKGHANVIQRTPIHLVGNAIKFTTHGDIQIHYGMTSRLKHRHQLVIEVRDRGCGIAPADQKRIFHPFTKLIPSYRQSHYQGAGLGLSLARKMVEEIGGTLHVASAGKNLGSTFTCTVPVERIQSVESNRASAEKTIRSTPHV